MAAPSMSRTGGTRRNRLGYLAVVSGTASYNRRARVLRYFYCLFSLLVVLPSAYAVPAAALVVLALLGPLLNQTMLLYAGGRLRRLTPLRLIAESSERTEGRHQLNFPAYLEIAGLCALVVCFSWVATDLPDWLRLIGLLLAVAYTTSVGHAIYIDHTWFNPDETRPPWWHEVLRRLAGPSTSVLVAALALPGTWTAEERVGVAVISAVPLLIGVRVADLDQMIILVPEIAEEEHQRGHDLVVHEIERALAPSLRALEALTRIRQDEAPVLHELAVHARSGLEEILDAPAGQQRYQPSLDTLLGPTLTVARAIGVDIEARVEPESLSEADTETAAWCLQDLVGNAINADASSVGVRLSRSGPRLVITVTDDGSPMHLAVWKAEGTSSGRLEQHLVALGGALHLEAGPGGKMVTASWLSDTLLGAPGVGAPTGGMVT
jgi:hypothetical protein